ncbi:hypothetical protein B0H14DRAFT_2571683 [Mycena olivaceomarginata]|nr:hypothetical protein B0H14DRAFT_2571683 [Mycena olivaceomarginata]
MLGLGFDQPQGFRNWPTTARDRYVHYIPPSGFVGHSIARFCTRRANDQTCEENSLIPRTLGQITSFFFHNGECMTDPLLRKNVSGDSDLCMASAGTSFGSSGREGPARSGLAGEFLPIVIHYEEHTALGRGHGKATGGNCSVHGADSGS